MSYLGVKPPGSCPYGICPKLGDHLHSVCDECETVDYTNAHCLTCRTMRWTYLQQLGAAWAAVAQDAIDKAMRPGGAAA